MRIGFLSLRVYGENTDFFKVGECCRIVNRDEDLEKVREQLRIRRDIEHNCSNCRGCPMYDYSE